MIAEIWAGSFLAELELGLGGHLKVSQASLQPQAGPVPRSPAPRPCPACSSNHPQRPPPASQPPSQVRANSGSRAPPRCCFPGEHTAELLCQSRPCSTALPRDACPCWLPPSRCHPQPWQGLGPPSRHLLGRAGSRGLNMRLLTSRAGGRLLLHGPRCHGANPGKPGPLGPLGKVQPAGRERAGPQQQHQ